MKSAAVPFRGNLSLEVDEEGLEARIILIPQEDGAEWSEKKLLDLLATRGIRTGIDRQALARVLTGKAIDEPLVIARGNRGEDAQGEEIKPAKLPVPEELYPVAERVFRSHPRAAVHDSARRAIAPERLREWGQGFAEAGQVLATIRPPRKGQDGLNLFGKPIKRRVEETPGIWTSDGIRESGGELKAEVSGFLRFGNNWLELIPYTRRRTAVRAAPDRLACLLDFEPGSEAGDLPDPEAILEEAIQQGFTVGTLLSAKEIQTVLEQAASANQSLQDFPLTRKEDAEIRVEVAEDRQKAFLSLKKGFGMGKPLSLKEIGEAIRKTLLKGMDLEKVKETILAFSKGADSRLDQYLLAQGRPPTTGEDGKINWAATFLDQKETSRLKAECAGRLAQIRDIPSLAELPLEAVEAMALVKARSRVAAIEPAKAGEPGMDVLGNVLPGLKGREPQLLLKENLQMVRNEVMAVCDGLLERGTQGDAVIARVRPHRDSEIRIRLSDDNMEALLSIIPHQGSGRPLSREAVEQAIAQAGARKGIDEQAVAGALLKALGGEAVEGLLIARGLPAQHARSRELTLKVLLATGRSLTLDEKGRADYKRQDKITMVQEGSLIAEQPPPPQTRDGWDVTGKALKGEAGAPPALQTGKNVERREAGDGSASFYALITGALRYEGSFLDVLNIYTVEGDVGLKSGNVKFPGAVRVTGSVLSGFNVVSGGSIYVEDGVEGSLLSAEESIVVQKGIKGEGRAVLRAKKGIQAYFAEWAFLLSIMDIRLTHACLHSQVKCNGKLTLESERGHLIGGKANTRQGISAMNLGSEREVRTEIHFGQDYLIKDRIDLETRESEKLKNRIAELDAVMKRLERQRPTDSSELEKARKEKIVQLKLLEQRSHRLFALRERFEEHFPSEVVVRGTAFPGVVLESHGRTLILREKKNQVAFSFNPAKGRIEEKPLGKER